MWHNYAANIYSSLTWKKASITFNVCMQLYVRPQAPLSWKQICPHDTVIRKTFFSAMGAHTNSHTYNPLTHWNALFTPLFLFWCGFRYQVTIGICWGTQQQEGHETREPAASGRKNVFTTPPQSDIFLLELEPWIDWRFRSLCHNSLSIINLTLTTSKQENQIEDRF